jgi:2-polyprenyl-6-methoxyphenol hydroxylase-like FAD-dependent oxidoreductase
MAAETEALIVGAGPVGLTMAAELIRHGMRCRVIDRSGAPSEHSKALVLWPRTLELLDLDDRAAAFVEAGMPAHGARIFAGGAELAALRFDGVASAFPFALMLPQSETERLLAACVERAGGAVERCVELSGWVEQPGGLSAAVRRADGSEERIRCRWLIGCDGAHSTVRHRLGIEFAGAAEPNGWLLADVHIDGPLAGDELRIDWHADGILAFFPIAPGRFRVIADCAPGGGDRAADPTLADVQRVVDTRGPGGLIVRDPVWLAGFRINERKVDAYAAGRVLLAGDAAHIHSPAGGQGMNTGMQDAFNLAWKLALVQRGRGRGALLESYSDERSAVGDMVLRNAAGMTRVATLRRPAAQHARNALLPLLAAFGAVRDRIRDTLAELTVHYRQSTLSRDDRGAVARARAHVDGIVPGDRAPDLAFVDGRSGAPVRLLAALRGTAHHLLVATESDGAAAVNALDAAVRRTYGDLIHIHRLGAAPASGVDLVDSGGGFQTACGGEASAAMLIRPDGYIGWLGDPADAPALLRHLATYLVPGA